MLPLPSSTASSKSDVAKREATALSSPGQESKKVRKESASSTPLQQALRSYYKTRDKLPPNIEGRQLPIVEVQLSLVESKREKERHRGEEKKREEETTGRKGTAEQERTQRNIPSLLEREENDSLRYYEEWHNVKNEMIAVAHMFGDKKENVQHVLVLGPAGIGKTTLSQYIAHQWARGELWPEVDYLFWLPLRNLAKDKYKDERVSLAQVLHENCLNAEGRKNVSLAMIQQVLVAHPGEEKRDTTASSHVLVVMDGFDEVAPHLGTEEEPTHIQTLFDEAYELGKVVLTSRPYQLVPELLSRFERQLENRGFNDAQIETYVNYYFSTLKPPRPELAQSLLQWLKGNSRLSGMSHDLPRDFHTKVI